MFKVFFFFFLPAVAEVKLRDDQYTLEHLHAFGMYNYLHCDSWYRDSVYYIDNLGRIMNLKVMLVRKTYLILGFTNKYDPYVSLWVQCPECWCTHTFCMRNPVMGLCRAPFLFDSILVSSLSSCYTNLFHSTSSSGNYSNEFYISMLM